MRLHGIFHQANNGRASNKAANTPRGLCCLDLNVTMGYASTALDGRGVLL
jgi:hypothetical protein